MPELNDDTQNVTVYNENGNPVGIILDGSVYRFAVDAKITSGGLTATRFRPRFFTSKTDITVLTTDTLLKSISFDGQLSGISILFDSKEIDVIIEVDSTEIFRVNSEDLDDSNEYRLGIGNGGDFFRSIFRTQGNTSCSLIRIHRPMC